ADAVPFLSFYFRGALHYLFSTVFNIIWFAIMFRYLADVRPNWKTVFAGAVFTGILFTIGRIILHALLIGSNINTLYGASASVVLLLLFVFYSSLILYYGASFTVAWAELFQHNIKPMPYAQFYTIQVPKDGKQDRDWRSD
ncbi:MAG TPA: YhjD/YihY/BrkB family envelope integrity protein, partial [Flavisolibacter sp.]|nr:YhjD/YihY/BrkB family envelope integrity protein [Flavisolibacter sp.]